MSGSPGSSSYVKTSTSRTRAKGRCSSCWTSRAGVWRLCTTVQRLVCDARSALMPNMPRTNWTGADTTSCAGGVDIENWNKIRQLAAPRVGKLWSMKDVILTWYTWAYLPHVVTSTKLGQKFYFNPRSRRRNHDIKQARNSCTQFHSMRHTCSKKKQFGLFKWFSAYVLQ